MTSHPTGRESLLVELVDEAGTRVGSATVDAAHRAPGRLHRAFSVLLVDPAGRLLLQRRSAAKTRFPLRWANACCGHPAPGQPVTEAARIRLVEEISARDVPLTEVGVYVYRAGDPSTGRVEHEYDHVLLGRIDHGVPLAPDPDEVADLRWLAVDEVRRAVCTNPAAYAPWLAGVLEALNRFQPGRRDAPQPGHRDAPQPGQRAACAPRLARRANGHQGAADHGLPAAPRGTEGPGGR